MAAGIEVWDANGNLVLDGTRRVMRYLGAVFLGGAAGSLADARIGAGTAWYAFQRSQTFKLSPGNNPTGTLGYMIPPIVSISGQTISWFYPAFQLADDEYAVGLMHYGVY